MEHIVSQNQARHSTDSSVLTADTSVTCQQQQQQLCDDGAVHISVKQTVERLLSRLGLSELTSLIDKTIVSQPNTDTIQVRVIRSSQHQSAAAADDGDDELRHVGESFALLLQLLRLCTNWNELASTDTALSDALARLTEHEFTAGTMGYGVHTEKTVEHLASILTATDSCEAADTSDTVFVDNVQQQRQPLPNMPRDVRAQWVNVKVSAMRDSEMSVIYNDDEDRLKYVEKTSVDADTEMIQEITVEMTSLSHDECNEQQQQQLSVTDGDDVSHCTSDASKQLEDSSSCQSEPVKDILLTETLKENLLSEDKLSKVKNTEKLTDAPAETEHRDSEKMTDNLVSLQHKSESLVTVDSSVSQVNVDGTVPPQESLVSVDSSVSQVNVDGTVTPQELLVTVDSSVSCEESLPDELQLSSDICRLNVAAFLRSFSRRVNKCCPAAKLDQTCDNDECKSFLVDNTISSAESAVNSDANAPAQRSHGHS